MRRNNFLTASTLGFAAFLVANAAAADVDAAAPAPGLLRDRPLEEMAHWNAPAAADSRLAEDFDDNYANDPGDSLFFAPGVWINKLDNSEPRIVLRGFGVTNRQGRSTVKVLRDGAPLTDVHGDTNSAEIDLLAVRRVDVFRGGGANLKFAGDNLGGVINFVSPTGRTVGYRGSLRIDAGSSIYASPGGHAHIDLAHASGDLDYYASFTGRYETGFRDNNQRADAIFNGNLGYEFSPTFTTRFFVEALRSEMELAGGLTPFASVDTPSIAAPAISLGPLFPGGPLISLVDGAENDEWGRALITGRLSNKTAFRLLGLDFDSGFHFAHRRLDSPQIDFVGILDETGNEWGANLAATKSLRLFNIETDLTLGGSYSTGSKDSDRFENIDGARGALLTQTTQKSSNITGFVDAILKPFKNLIVNIGGKFMKTDRDLTVAGSVEEENFIGVSARGGVIYHLTKNIQVFANAARTYEPPSMGELTSADAEAFNGLDEQDAFSYEAGIRGRLNNWVGWDVAVFNTDVEGEIINIDEPETNGLGTFVNTESTTHKGIEAGLDISIFPGRFGAGGGSLTLRNVYNYNDFRFNIANPLSVDGNRLAGVPEHVYRGELRYDADGRWFAGVNVEYAGGAFFADHENALAAPGYTLVGFSAGWRINDNLEIFASGENILDQNYAAGLTPVLSQSLQNGRIFTPGDRASAYAGMRLQF